MRRVLLFTIIFIFSCGVLYAMDAQLWNAPVLPDASVIWKDRPIEISGIYARASRYHSNMKTEEILQFYQDVLLKSGWQIKDIFKEQNIIAYIKENNYMYVGIRENGGDLGRDVFLVSSQQDLAICRIIAANMDNSGALISDCAGKDYDDLPRYPGSRRMMSIVSPEEGNILMYQAKGAPKEVGKFYLDNLKASGWKLINYMDPRSPEFTRNRLPEAEGIEKDAFSNFTLQKGDDTLLVTVFYSNRAEKLSTVSIVRSNARQPSSWVGG